MSKPTTGQTNNSSLTTGSRRAIVAIAALTVAGAAAGLTKVFNLDIFWHLASGDWMLSHMRVLGAYPYRKKPYPQCIKINGFSMLF